ncbi:MAG: hypothetical protein AAGI17_05355 [Planctomycetota bacterium]
MSVVDLWLPIIVSAVAVFFVSSILWMALPHHKGDVLSAPEDVEKKVGELGLKPGFYMFPLGMDGEAKDMKDPALQERMKNGPWGTLCVWPGAPVFARNLVLTFLVYLVVSAIVAYLASEAVPAGAPYATVFQVTGVAALLGYVFGGLPNGIFFGTPTRFVLTNMFDAIVFTLVTAGIFAAMWPEGAAALPAAGDVPAIPTP